MANELQIYVDLDVDMVSSKYINCNAKQFDKNTRYLRITCYSENKVYPLSATDHVVYVREGKADGFSVLNLCEIDEQGRIIIQLTEQMLAAQGMNYCDVLIAETGATIVDGKVESGRLLSTMNFCINVIPSPIDTSAIESSYEYNALNELLEKAARDYTYIITEASAYATAAEQSAQSAAASVAQIGTAVSDAQGYANAASQSATNAASSASAASTFETNASTSASNAAASATNAASSASNASTSETNAHQSEINAASSASNASDSATAASGSATSAANSASNASDDAELARQWAVGLSGSGQAQPSDTNNAYYWAQVAASAASGGLKPLVVQSLPTSNISTSIVYLVPSSDPKTRNIYDEYLNTTGTTSGWELIGSTGIDLSAYAEVSKLSIGFDNGNLQLKYDGTTISQVAIPAGNSKPPVATYDESPALYPHAVDDLIYYNDELYKVTASISVGDGLSTNTNITTNTGIEEGQQVFINKIPGGSGGGGGVSAFEDLTDVDFTNLQNGQVPVYNSQTGKWVNGEVGMRIVQIPQPKTVQGQPKEYTYDGTQQTFEWDSIDSAHILLQNENQINAGNYNVIASLKGSGDVWSDLTNAPKSFPWTIAKAQGSFSLSANSASVDVNNPTATINVSNVVGDGVISVASDDDNVATASISNGVITITGVGTGTATITVTMADGTNYLGTSATISVTATYTTQITLVVNGAKGDNIIVTDENGNQTDFSPIAFDTNATSKTVTAEIPSNGAEYKFASANIDHWDGTADKAEKVIKLDPQSTTADVMPNGLNLFWRGNQKNGFTGFATAGATHSSSNYTMANPNAITNKAHCLGTSNKNEGLITNSKVDVTNYLRYIILASTTNIDTTQYKGSMELSTVKTNMYADANTYWYTHFCKETAETKYNMDISTNSGEVYVLAKVRALTDANLDIFGAWLEKKRSLPVGDTMNVTITIEGAKEDKITVYDKYGEIVDYVDFATGATSATVTLAIRTGGEKLKFVSSVTKDANLKNYYKWVDVDDETTNVVLMFSGALYWGGNQNTQLTGGWSDINSSFDLSGTTCPRDSSGSTTFETNHIYIESTNGTAYPPYIRQVGTANPINISNYSKLHIIADIYTYSAATDEGGLFASGLRPNKTSSGGNGYANKENTVLNTWETFHIEKDLSQMTATSAYAVMMTIRKTKARIKQVWCD